MLVSEVMNTNLAAFSVSPETPFQAAVEQMSCQRQSCLIVKDADDRPLGIVTERDLTACFACYLRAPNTMHAALADIMTHSPVCVAAGSTCEDALTLSRGRSIRHFPVIDADYRLIGLVSQSSLLDAFASLLVSQAQLKSNLNELKALSLEDPLMGIGNRRAMEVDLAFTQAEAKRHNKPYAVGLFDVDCFKNYNDHYGHQAGDEVLRALAETAKGAIRESDRMYRYGGEEVLVLMPESDLDAARICGERIRAAVERLQIAHTASPFGFLTLSGGVASGLGGDWQRLTKQADEALYEAKASGRNRVQAFLG